MRLLFLIVFFLVCSLDIYGQLACPSNRGRAKIYGKSNVDFDSYKDWESISQVDLDGDGKFYSYVVENTNSAVHTLVLRGIDGKWSMKSTLVGWYSLSSDRRFVIWINEHDSLCIVRWGASEIICIRDVLSYSMTDSRILCQLVNRSDTFAVFDLKKMRLNRYRASKIYDLDHDGIILLVEDNGKQSLLFSDTRYNLTYAIWSGSGFVDLFMAADRSKVGFFINSPSDQCWIYDIGGYKALSIPVSLDENFHFSGIGFFSADKNRVFVDLVNRGVEDRSEKISMVNVWSYMSSKLPSQTISKGVNNRYTVVIRLSDYSFLKLGAGSEWWFPPKYSDDHVLVRRQSKATSGYLEGGNLLRKYNWELISLKTGSGMMLDSIKNNAIVEFSPSGKYVIYFDKSAGQYYVYRAATGNRRCITCGIDEEWEKNPERDCYGRFIGGWVENDLGVLIYGQRDIWRVDPSGAAPALNLTNGYGKKRNVVFSLSLDEYSHRYIRENESLILSAFNLESKYNGFYKKFVNARGDPDSLTMGPYIFDLSDNPYVPKEAGYAPIKARNANVYIVKRMSSREAPNFFLTKNFRTFKQITYVNPVEKYNWYFTELHTWRSLNGRQIKGILYKPENFDSTKKYPVIFYCYEKRSDALNAFLVPGVLDGACSINIPYYVSNGFLVFSPDIYYSVGDPMKGTYDAVLSAARYISTLPFVNRNKIGIQGCSWGAVQVNYLVTHCRIFAAACSASGIADWVSSYGSITGSGESMQDMYEYGQLRMGETLWGNIDGYIRNSAVFNVDCVTTPLLLMHTREDDICRFQNIIELFTGLRRLGKRVWMLVYEGNHGVLGDDGRDFGLRMKQFFDHYLKDTRAPKWMTRAGWKNGFELDDSIKTPGKGLADFDKM